MLKVANDLDVKVTINNHKTKKIQLDIVKRKSMVLFNVQSFTVYFDQQPIPASHSIYTSFKYQTYISYILQQIKIPYYKLFILKNLTIMQSYDTSFLYKTVCVCVCV